MVYVRVRDVVRNETFENCEGVTYGVPMLPEDEEELQNAIDQFRDALGNPAWLSSVDGVLRADGRTMEIEVSVAPGYPAPLLPPRWHGYRIQVVYPTTVPQDVQDRRVAKAVFGRVASPKPYPPGTRYGLVKRENLKRGGSWPSV